MSANLDDFDLNAAWARRAQGDLHAFIEALAVRLEGALPDRVEVQRRRVGLLSRSTKVRAITVHERSAEFSLAYSKGALKATKAKAVRGVVISTVDQGVSDWLAEVRAEVIALAGELGSGQRRTRRLPVTERC